jgi:hypothetical protein
MRNFISPDGSPTDSPAQERLQPFYREQFIQRCPRLADFQRVAMQESENTLNCEFNGFIPRAPTPLLPEAPALIQ